MISRYFTGKMKMADVVSANHNLILVMPRLGIPLGFGEHSVQEVCERNGLPVDLVLLIFNVYTFDDYAPDADAIHTIDAHRLVAYLESSHAYYLNERLPHIQRHLVRVASNAGSRYSQILTSFFADYEKEVREHFSCEEQQVFPYIHSLLQGTRNSVALSDHFADNHTALIDTLSDLTRIVYKYLPGDVLIEDLSELVFFVMQLSSDLEKHALLEEKVLIPYVKHLERSVQ
ncbi:MAG: hemerythrin domain-containing protein [Bacteroidales bacterium]|nr:hemerythrin domain-containing protein [Bacteroidales bacterium]